jgi:hypothetical protein
MLLQSEEFLEWVGGELESEAFDFARVNQALCALRQGWMKGPR